MAALAREAADSALLPRSSGDPRNARLAANDDRAGDGPSNLAE